MEEQSEASEGERRSRGRRGRSRASRQSRRPWRARGHARRGRGRERSRSRERERRPTRQGRGHGRLVPEGNSEQRVADEEQLQVGGDKTLMIIFFNNQYPSAKLCTLLNIIIMSLMFVAYMHVLSRFQCTLYIIIYTVCIYLYIYTYCAFVENDSRL